MAWVTEFDLNGKQVVLFVVSVVPPSELGMLEYSDPLTGTRKRFSGNILTWQEHTGSCPDGAALAHPVHE